MTHARLHNARCSSTATKDDEIYLLWNLDMPRPTRMILDRFRIFVAGGGKYRYLAWGIPGFLHIGLMNEKGLSFVGNAVGMSDGGLDGNITYELIGSALTSCRKVEGVAGLSSCPGIL